MMCVLCGEPESMCTCPAEVTIFAQAHLVGRDGNNAIINGETLRVLIERAQAWGKLKSTAVLSAVPEGREQGWISFKERKPRSGGVLAVDDEGEIDLYQWNLAVEYSKEGQEHRLSHWMPLPNPPSPQDDSRSKA